MVTITNRTQVNTGWVFAVEIEEGGRKTVHAVTVDELYWKKLTSGKVFPEILVKKSFEFLLAREPKESILREFNLTKIQHYFPEYEESIKLNGK